MEYLIYTVALTIYVYFKMDKLTKDIFKAKKEKEEALAKLKENNRVLADLLDALDDKDNKDAKSISSSPTYVVTMFRHRSEAQGVVDLCHRAINYSHQDKDNN